MVAATYSEMLAPMFQTTWCHILEDHTLHIHLSVNFISHMLYDNICKLGAAYSSKILVRICLTIQCHKSEESLKSYIT